jgi:hypothetical protein
MAVLALVMTKVFSAKDERKVVKIDGNKVTYDNGDVEEV